MTSIRLANILSLNPVGIGINDAQIAMLHFNSGVERGYVKQLPNNEIAKECICSVIGRMLELDIPEPAICRYENDFYYGCIDAGHPNLKQWAKLKDKEVYSKLIAWKGLLDAACFDGWIGNPDRHGANILFDGGENFFLIDHGKALIDTKKSFNYLMNTVVFRDTNKDELTKQRTKKQTQKIASGYNSVDYKNIKIAENTIYYHVGNLVKLLESRLNNIDEFTSDCINPAQASLNL